MSFTKGWQVFTHISPNPRKKTKSLEHIQVRKPRFKWFRVWSNSTSRCISKGGKARKLHRVRPKVQRRTLSGLTQENSHVRKYRLPKNLLTWSESSVTRSPSLVIPSSFRSFRWGQRARQKALAMCSVSRLWSAGSLRQLCWSSFSRKNTCSPNERLLTLCPRRLGKKLVHRRSVHEHPDPLRRQEDLTDRVPQSPWAKNRALTSYI